MKKARPLRYWVIGGAGLIVALIIGANAHFHNRAVSSQPGCAEATVTSDATGAQRVLQPAKNGC
jgi:hypothetical protein